MLKSTVLQFLLYPPSLVLCVLENAKILCCWFRPNASKFAHISNQSERHRLSVWTRILTFWAGVPLSSRHWMNGSFRCIMAQDEYNRYSEHTIQQHSNTHPLPSPPRDIFHSRWLIRHYSVLEMCTTNYQMKTKHDHNPTNLKQCRDWKRQWDELFCFPFTTRILDEVRSR